MVTPSRRRSPARGLRGNTMLVCVLAAYGCGNVQGPVPGDAAALREQPVAHMYYYSNSLGVGSEEERDALRSRLLALPDITSVSGTYMLQRSNLGGTAFGPPVRCDIRWVAEEVKGGPSILVVSQFLTMPLASSGGAEVLRTYAQYRSFDPRSGPETESMMRTQSGNNVRIVVDPPRPADGLPGDWEWEWHHPIPSAIASAGLEKSRLRDFFKSGECALAVRDGQRILAQVLKPSAGAYCEVYFDDEGRVARVDTVARLRLAEDEIRKRYSGDLFDLKMILWSVRFERYTMVNGIDFPTVIEEYHYRGFDSEEIQRAKRGEMSQTDAYVRAALARCPPLVAWARRAEFDVSTLRVNEELTKEDFILPVPSGTIAENRQGTQFLVGAPGEDVSELAKSLPTSSPLDTVLMIAGGRRLRLASMYIPWTCPMLLLEYKDQTPLLEALKPPTLPAVSPRRINWVGVVAICSAVAGVLAFAAFVVLKRKR